MLARCGACGWRCRRWRRGRAGCRRCRWRSSPRRCRGRRSPRRPAWSAPPVWLACAIPSAGPRRGVNGVGGAQVLRRERRARGGVDGVSRAHVLPRCRLGESRRHVGRLRGGGRGGECRGCQCNGGGAGEDASERHGGAPCVWWTVPIRRSPRSSCRPTARLQLGYIAVVAGRAGGRQAAPRDGCVQSLRPTAAGSSSAMTAAQNSPPAPLKKPSRGHAYCIPVVRELPLRGRRSRQRSQLVTARGAWSERRGRLVASAVSPVCRRRE